MKEDNLLYQKITKNPEIFLIYSKINRDFRKPYNLSNSQVSFLICPGCPL